MTYEKAFADAKKALLKSATNISGDFAIQFNIVGEGEGYFYAEVKGGVLNVEPYDYNDRNAIFASDAGTIAKLAKGTITAKAAVKKGLLYVESIDPDGIIAAFDSLFTDAKAEKKAVKAVAPKAEKKAVKAAAPKAEKNTVKAAAPKAEKNTVKTAAPKAEKKAVKAAPDTAKNSITIGTSGTETVKVEIPSSVAKPNAPKTTKK